MSRSSKNDNNRSSGVVADGAVFASSRCESRQSVLLGVAKNSGYACDQG